MICSTNSKTLHEKIEKCIIDERLAMLTSTENKLKYFENPEHATEFRKRNCLKCTKRLKCTGDAQISSFENMSEERDYMLYHMFKKLIAQHGNYVTSKSDPIGRCLKIKAKA